MRKNTKRILGAILLLVCLLVVERFVFGGMLTAAVKDYFSDAGRETKALTLAQTLSRSGDDQAAQTVYETLINETSDDIIYERALRDYSRTLAKTDPTASLAQMITLATDTRVRASARAGAIERLAELYFTERGYTREELDAAIFSNPTFAALRYAGAAAPASERLLLEYANRVSLRPLVSAYLMREYGRAWYGGEAKLKDDFDEVFALYQNLMVAVPATSPNLPKTHAAAAAGLFYAKAADLSDPDYRPEPAVIASVDAAEGIVEFIRDIPEISLPELPYFDFAPLAQYETIFTAAAAVPYNSATERALASYDEYLLTNPDLVPLVEQIPTLVTLVETLRAAIPAEFVTKLPD